jgi:hypothetical protein
MNKYGKYTEADLEQMARERSERDLVWSLLGIEDMRRTGEWKQCSDEYWCLSDKFSSVIRIELDRRREEKAS